MSKREIVIVLILAVALVAGLALGATMTAQRGDLTARRDQAQEDAQALSLSLDEAKSRVDAIASSPHEPDEQADALEDASSERDYRQNEVSLLTEALDKTLTEIEKQQNTIDTQRETLAERDNMLASLKKDRDETLDELTKLADENDAVVVMPTQSASPTAMPTAPPVSGSGIDDVAGDIVASVGNREITYRQVLESFEQYMPQYQKKHDLTDISTVRMLMLDELNYLVELAILGEWANDLGIESSVDNFMDNAGAFYNSLLDQRTVSYLDDGAESEDAAREAARAYLEKHHYTQPYIAQIMFNEDLNKRVKEHFANGAAPTEDALKAEFDRRIESIKATYEAEPSAFEYDIMKDAPIYYYPEGYRVVRHVLFLFTGEEQLEVAQLLLERAALEQEDERIAEIDQRIEAVSQRYTVRAEEVKSAYESGTSFEELIEALGEDPGMTEGITAERGYYVSKDATLFDVNFRDGAMAIEKTGELSPPIISGLGVHVILYEGDAPSGPADYEVVRADLSKTYADEHREREYQSAYDEWTKAHPVKKSLERIMNATLE